MSDNSVFVSIIRLIIIILFFFLLAILSNMLRISRFGFYFSLLYRAVTSSFAIGQVWFCKKWRKNNFFGLTH